MVASQGLVGLCTVNPVSVWSYGMRYYTYFGIRKVVGRSMCMPLLMFGWAIKIFINVGC